MHIKLRGTFCTFSGYRMGMGRYGRLLLTGCVLAHGCRDCSVGRVHEVLVHGRGDHAGSQGRERVL